MLERLYLAYTRSDAEWLIAHPELLDQGLIVYSGIEAHLVFQSAQISAQDAVDFYQQLDWEDICSEAEQLHRQFEPKLRQICSEYGVSILYRNINTLDCVFHLLYYFFYEVVVSYHLAIAIVEKYQPQEIWVNQFPLTSVTQWGFAPPPYINYENQVWGAIKHKQFLLKPLEIATNTLSSDAIKSSKVFYISQFESDKHQGEIKYTEHKNQSSLQSDILIALQANFIKNYSPIGQELTKQFSLKTLDLNNGNLWHGWYGDSNSVFLPLGHVSDTKLVAYDLLLNDDRLSSVFSNYPLDIWPIIRPRIDLLLNYDLPTVKASIERAEWLLKQINPKLIVMAEEVSLPARTLGAVASLYEIKKLVIQHGAGVSFDERLSGKQRPNQKYWEYNYGETRPDYITVWGDYGRRYFLEALGWSDERVMATGWPWVEKEIRQYLSNDTIVQKYNLPLRLLFLSTSTTKFSHYLYQTIFDVCKQLNAELILRPHGAENVKYLDNLASRTNIHITIDNATPLLEQITNSDIVMGAATSVLSYAIALSKPCIFVDLLAIRDIMPYALEGAAIGVYEREELIPAIETLLNNPEALHRQQEKQKAFTRQYLGSLDGQATERIIAFIKAKVDSLNINLLERRYQIAQELLNIADHELERAYTDKLGREYKLLLNSGIKQQTLTPAEQALIAELVQHISRGLEQPKAIQYLLAAMLYQRADYLPLQYDLAHIPDWLLNDYLQFLFSAQFYFQEIGEADHYSQYMQGWVDYLHTAIFSNSDSTFWHQIVNNFTQIANFIPVYFNEENLKNIYVKRAEIIEFFLNLKDHEIDYEFADRLVPRKKIRIGILATHFTPSAETYAYLPVYEYLSRDFEVILYSLNQTGHPLEQYCQLSANAFRLLPQELSEQVNTIRADDVDILFIATNVTAVTNQICLLVTHRLAKIQVTSGGSVVTTGMRNIDYYISGTLTDPSPTAQDHYQEKLVKLEGTAHCFSYGTEEGKITTTLDRNNLGIPENAVVFISCANYFKTVPELMETWTKIITQVPNSVLVLLPFGPNWSNNYPKIQFINHLNSIFTKHDLATERLIVLDPQPVPDREDMKEYYKIADIYLDSFPFSGTTSLIEPLQVNLPVIARQGDCFRSAMGAAMILTLNIPGLVADSEESYIQLAVELGNNFDLRQQKSDEIQAAMNNNPSFLNSRSYSAKMGNLFQEFFKNYLAENLEQTLRLRDINLIIFPDWTQPEDELGFELQQVIQILANHPNNEKIALIIYTANIASEDAEIFLSSVAMNLLMEDLDITDTIDISLVDKLSDMQWQSLLTRIYGRVILEHEDKIAITQTLIKNLNSYQLDRLISEM